jgi:CubicO group peptidase (beta-lactamase class C family)
VPAEWVATSTRSTAPHTEPGQPVIAGMRLPQGYGYQWWLMDGDRGDFMAIGVYNQLIYVDPVSAVTIVSLSANRAYGTTPDGSGNLAGESIEYLRTIAASLA